MSRPSFTPINKIRFGEKVAIVGEVPSKFFIITMHTTAISYGGNLYVLKRAALTPPEQNLYFYCIYGANCTHYNKSAHQGFDTSEIRDELLFKLFKQFCGIDEEIDMIIEPL